MTKKTYIFIGIGILLIIATLIGIYFSRGPQVFESESIPYQEVSNERDYAVVTWATGLDTPWGMVFIDDDTMLVTERGGTIRLIENGHVRQEPYITIDEVDEAGEGGLMGIDTHPEFPHVPYVFVMYTSPVDNRIVRIVHDAETMTGSIDTTILEGLDKARNHNGGRIKFGPDGYLYVTTGEQFRAERSQDTNSLSGKILRITDEGDIPSDNPFDNEVYSYGHRNAQGLTWDREGNMFSSEHGPSGEFGIFAHDEINHIIAGGNYGWPRVVGQAGDERYRDPMIVWTDRAVPPAGMDMVEDRIYVATLRSRALKVLTVEDVMITSVSTLFEGDYEEGGYGRLRDVVYHNNALYVATSNRDGRGTPRDGDDRILRITW